jgi:hypothetical protein
MFTTACTVSIVLASLGQCGPGGCAISADYGFGYGYAPASYGYAYGSSCVPPSSGYAYGYAPYAYAQPMAAMWHPTLSYGFVPHYHYAAPSYSYAASPTWMGSGGYGVSYAPYYPAAQPVDGGAFYASSYAWAPAYEGPVAEVAVVAIPVRRGIFGGGRGFHPFRRLFGGGRGFFRGGCG